MNKKVLLLGSNDMSRISRMSGGIDVDFLTPSIYVAQSIEIKRILTPALYDKIVLDYSADTLTGEYEIIYDEFIVDMLSYFAIRTYIDTGAYSINQNGIFKNAPENTEQVSSEEIDRLAKKYGDMGYAIENLFIEYMKTSTIPEYDKNDKKKKGNWGLNWFV